MERDETLPESGPDTTARVCVLCQDIKLYTIEHWPASHGRAVGSVCRLCSRSRKRDFDDKYANTRAAARTQTLVSLADNLNAPAGAVVASKVKDTLAAEVPLRQLEVAKALRAGSTLLNEHAQAILGSVLKYAEDSSSPHHEWALRLLVERVLPKKLYEDLGANAAGIASGGAGGASRPSVTIIVQPAAAQPPPGEAAVVVVEGESERV
jgi:hypothetical protein